MLYARLKAAEKEIDRIFGGGPAPVTLLSLTAHQRCEDGRPRPPGEVLADLLDGWDKFRRVLRRHTDGRRTEYLRIVEPHESGYPHLHVAIFGIADPTLEEKVREMWAEKYEVGTVEAHENAVSVARGRSAQVSDPAAYLMKYLGKTAVRPDGGTPAPYSESGDPGHPEAFEAFAALLWVTEKRQFSASESLSKAMSRNKGGGSGTWEFVGVGYGIDPGSYAGEDATQLLDHLDDGPWRPPPRAAVESGPSQASLEAA